MACGSDMSTDRVPALRLVLDFLIPDSEDGSIPGAVRAGVAEDLVVDGNDAIGVFLETLEALAFSSVGRHFTDLSSDDIAAFMESHGDLWHECKRLLGPLVLSAYFTKPAVLSAMGLPATPPFPVGFGLEPIDFDLLAPVVERGIRYREGRSQEDG